MATHTQVGPQDTTGLSWRALTTSDIDRWFELVAKYQTDEGAQERTRRWDLETLTRQSWVDLSADSRVAVDAGGAFRAVGYNAFRPGATDTITVTLRGGVDPDWRERGLGRHILEWQRVRAEQKIAEIRAADPAAARLPARIGAAVEDHMTGRARLFEAAGFTTSRWFIELRRPLHGPYDVSELAVDGLSVRRFDDGLSERVRLAHNDAFRDHWGSTAHGPEAWRTDLLEDDALRPQQSFAIVDTADPAEPVAAYVINCEFEHDWKAQGFTEGYTVAIGVRRPWRGRGLAKHLLELSAREFAKAGHPYAALDADADNPTGAVGLYESLGYRVVHRTSYYSLTEL